MSTYYNENDPFMVAWLRELVKAKAIPDGEIDPRAIADVRSADLAGFDHCHFFAGIGGWAYALALAGWPADRECWTGSTPCQPFSNAGQAASTDDARDLWPEWFRLIRECHPLTIFGEQVASPDGLAWWDRVSLHLEAENYALGAMDLCAPSIGAWHIRQRLYFVGHTERARLERYAGHGNYTPERNRPPRSIGETSPPRGMADTDAQGFALLGAARVHDDNGKPGHDATGCGALVDWQRCEWLDCIDGKARPIEPGSFPLANGVSARVGRLRGYGNAIVPQLAASFIEAYLDATL